MYLPIVEGATAGIGALLSPPRLASRLIGVLDVRIGGRMRGVLLRPRELPLPCGRGPRELFEGCGFASREFVGVGLSTIVYFSLLARSFLEGAV